jgi:hypothetical protein
VAAIEVAQDFAPVFIATEKQQGKAVWFPFAACKRWLTCYYCYDWDDDFGPAFVKVCAYPLDLGQQPRVGRMPSEQGRRRVRRVVQRVRDLRGSCCVAGGLRCGPGEVQTFVNAGLRGS